MMPKKAKKAKKEKSCSIKGCRKHPMEGVGTCREHSTPEDVVIRLTETELLRLGKISSEMRVALLNARVASIEFQDLKSKAEAELRKKEEDRASFVKEAQQLKDSYDILTAELASKYGIENPTKMVVDPDTGVVRDLGTT